MLRASAARAWTHAPQQHSRHVCVRASSSGTASGSGSEAGRVFLITGSTDGIGKHTAVRLAAAGATVLVHGRDPGRVAAAVEAVARASSSSGGGGSSSSGSSRNSSSSSSRVQGYVADLSSLAAVRQLAAQVVQDHGRLHALVNNAGVYEREKRLSADVFELTWAVNVLAPFLLTSLLWRHVDARIITTASISAASHLDLGNLQQERGYSAHGAYSLSKLCDIIFTLQLAQRLKAHGSSVKAATLDPGTVNTKMLLAGWGRIGMEVRHADNTLRLLTDPAVAELSGAYLVGHHVTRPPQVAEDAALQQQLWQLWQEQTGASWD